MKTAGIENVSRFFYPVPGRYLEAAAYKGSGPGPLARRLLMR
jgi:hypothetical protein